MTPARPAFNVRALLERLRFPALAALGVLVAHDAVFAAQYGLGAGMDEAMAMSGHAYWPAFVAMTLLVVAAGTGAAIRVILGLRRLVRGLPMTPGRSPQAGYAHQVAHLWPRLLVVVALAFLVQENAEHILSGQPAPGLWALTAPGYPLAIPVLVAVTGLLSLVGGWFQWQRETLVERLRAARVAALRRHHTAHAPHGRWALLAALLAHRWILLRRDTGRAPPLAATA